MPGSDGSAHKVTAQLGTVAPGHSMKDGAVSGNWLDIWILHVSSRDPHTPEQSHTPDVL